MAKDGQEDVITYREYADEKGSHDATVNAFVLLVELLEKAENEKLVS